MYVIIAHFNTLIFHKQPYLDMYSFSIVVYFQFLPYFPSFV